jgi:DNA-binding MurR/RpiR family transcriptional regulator
MTPAPDRVSAALQQAYPELSRSQQQVARVILEDPMAAALMSAGEVADKVGVHASTVVRLAQRLGYEGYPSLQKDLRARISQYPTFFHQVEQAGVSPPAQYLLSQVFERARRNIDQASRTVDTDELTEFVSALSGVRRIVVIGIGVAQPVAAYLASSLQVAGMHVCEPHDSIGMAQQLATLGAQDVVILVDFHRYYREITQLAEVAKDTKATILAISDSTVADLAPLANRLLVVPSEGAGPRTSLVAAMALVETILALLTVTNRTTAQAAMQNIDDAYRRLDTFTA